MAISKTAGLIIGVVCAIVVVTIAIIAVVTTIGPQMNDAPAKPPVGQWKVNTRQLRPAARVPYNAYGYKTPAAAMPTVAAVQGKRIQDALGSKYNLRMYPAGVEELQWAAANGVTIGPGLPTTSVTVVPAPPGSACQTLPGADSRASAVDGKLSVNGGAADWGAFILETDADAATLNAAIGKANGSNSGPSAPNETTPSVILAGAASKCAPSNAAALAACVA